MGVRQCSVQGTSEVPFGWNKELDFKGFRDRVVLREEIGEGGSDVTTEGVPCHAEQFALCKWTFENLLGVK